MVDLVAPQFEAKEPLQSSESMWVRLEFTIPADLKNDHSLLSRLFSPSVEYHQWYSSQEIILDESQRKITAFALNELTRDEDIRASLHEAKKELPKEFPGAPLPDVKDWRLFLYREYGLSVEKIEALAAEPKKPAKREIHYLPLDAYPRSRLGWAPSVLYRIFRRKAKQPRVASCHEFWIGTEHRRNDPKGYGIGLSLRLTNDFLIWAGGAALIVSIVHFLAHRFHWFGLH